MAPANEGFDILDMFVDSGNDAAFDDVGQPRADAPADVDALETRSNASVEGSESDDEGADDPNDIEVPDGPDEADTPAEQAMRAAFALQPERTQRRTVRLPHAARRGQPRQIAAGMAVSTATRTPGVLYGALGLVL